MAGYEKNLTIYYEYWTLHELMEFLHTATIGANHISGALTSPIMESNGRSYYSNHVARDAHSFDYLDNFPIQYFSDYCAIEVENSMKEQLIFKKYIESLLEDKEKLIKRAA